jgi:hypothetical protein
MTEPVDFALAARKYRDVFGAALSPAFDHYVSTARQGETGALLGYLRAGEAPLFLERYLDRPIEVLVSNVLGRAVARDRIVELGNFAAGNGIAMIELWGSAANDLGATCEVAVATLTAPLRRMFARIGVPIREIAPALPGRLGAAADLWGSYYDHDPIVCCGPIADGQRAIAAFLQRRSAIKAA